MNYIAPRNMTVISLSGRSVEFKKGEPTYAPPQMHQELVAKGVVSESEVEEPTENTPSAGPASHADREKEMFAAFELIATRNARNDFTAGGTPNLKPLAEVLGWAKVDAKERDELWAKFQQGGNK